MKRVNEIDILAIAGVTELAVAGVGSVWSKSFDMPIKRSMSLEAKIEGSGAVDVEAFIEVSSVDLETAEESLTNANYVVAQGDTATIDAAATGVFVGAFAPAVNKKCRIKFVGAGANHASTKVTRLKILLAEDN